MKKPKKPRQPKLANPLKPGTFKHPYQMDLFAPPLASSMRDVGYLAKTAIAFLLSLTFAYVGYSTSSALSVDTKTQLFAFAWYIVYALVAVIVLEALRNVRWLDFLKFRGLRPILVLLNGSALVAGLYAFITLVATLQGAHDQNITMDAKARAAQKAEALKCTDQRTAEIDTATKRRNWLGAEMKRCALEFELKPKGIFSQETVTTHCANQRSALERGERGLRAANAKVCSTGSVNP